MTNYELYLAISKLVTINFKMLESCVGMMEKRLSNRIEILEGKIDMYAIRFNTKE